jgi:hypothetical protein
VGTASSPAVTARASACYPVAASIGGSLSPRIVATVQALGASRPGVQGVPKMLPICSLVIRKGQLSSYNTLVLLEYFSIERGIILSRKGRETPRKRLDVPRKHVL